VIILPAGMGLVAPSSAALTWTETFLTTLTDNGGDWSGGYTTRIVVPSSALAEATHVRFTLTGGLGPFSISACTCGLAATSGNPYDFSATPVTVTAGGSPTFVVPSGGDIVTDPISLAIPAGRNVVFAWYATGGTGRYATAPSGWADYYDIGNHVTELTPTVEGSEGRLYFIRRVECVEV
jgi:hypothetical protein